MLMKDTGDTSEPPPPPRPSVVIRIPNHGKPPPPPPPPRSRFLIRKEEAAPPASPLAPAPEEHRNLERKRTTSEVRDPTDIAGPSSAPLPPAKASVPYNSIYLRSKSKEAQGKAKASGFCIRLTKEEIMEDLSAFAGFKPPRYPKRRPKVIQEKLDAVFPGLSLHSATALHQCGSLI